MIECPVDESVPMPTDSKASFLDVRTKAEAACNAAKLLFTEGFASETGPDSPEQLREATAKMLSNLATNKPAAYPAVTTPAGAIYVNNMLAEYDMEVVKDAKRLRAYVTNKLILESENNDPRIRIKALELIGKISDVGLFTERSEVTVTNRSTIELENTLKDKLRKLMGTDKAQDVDVVDVVDSASLVNSISVPNKTLDLDNVLTDL